MIRFTVALLWALCIPTLGAAQHPATPSNTVAISVLDVGQGDAVLVQLPGKFTILYDGGDIGTDLSPELERRHVESIDLVIASHNHADHIGGLESVIREVPFRYYMDSGIPHTTQVYQRVLEAVAASGALLLEPEQRSITAGDATIHVLPPMYDPEVGLNNNSVGIRVEYGDLSLFLGGDAEREQWDYWIESYPELLEPVTVHKASHHGSRNGDTEMGIRMLSPAIVVIGVGQDNPYGHPHPEAMNLYYDAGSRIFTTAEHGAITILGDGDGRTSVYHERGAVR